VLPRLVAIASPCPCWWSSPSSSAGRRRRRRRPTTQIASFQAFFNNLRDGVDLLDVANGVFKSFCLRPRHRGRLLPPGLQTIGGPRGIGRSVTKAVVNSIVLIVILDYS
jgi:ABC-type transporter Mla maintaining outer membrane lipid asymmetry permease subunit MlaE